jgi:hypothetical protein
LSLINNFRPETARKKHNREGIGAWEKSTKLFWHTQLDGEKLIENHKVYRALCVQALIQYFIVELVSLNTVYFVSI